MSKAQLEEVPKFFVVACRTAVRDIDSMPEPTAAGNLKDPVKIAEDIAKKKEKQREEARDVPTYGVLDRVVILQSTGEIAVDDTDDAAGALMAFLIRNPDQPVYGYHIKTFIRLAAFQLLSDNKSLPARVWIDRTRLSSMPERYVDPYELVVRSTEHSVLGIARIEKQFDINVDGKDDSLLEDALSAYQLVQKLGLH